MASRWMQQARARMRDPYTAYQRMHLPSQKSPPPDVLDAIADAKFFAGWTLDKVCPGCGTCRPLIDAARACHCDYMVIHLGATRGDLLIVRGPSGIFKLDGTLVAANGDKPAPASRQRYQPAGTRARRELGLSGHGKRTRKTQRKARQRHAASR